MSNDINTCLRPILSWCLPLWISVIIIMIIHNNNIVTAFLRIWTNTKATRLCVKYIVLVKKHDVYGYTRSFIKDVFSLGCYTCQQVDAFDWCGTTSRLCQCCSRRSTNDRQIWLMYTFKLLFVQFMKLISWWSFHFLKKSIDPLFYFGIQSACQVARQSLFLTLSIIYNNNLTLSLLARCWCDPFFNLGVFKNSEPNSQCELRSTHVCSGILDVSNLFATTPCIAHAFAFACAKELKFDHRLSWHIQSVFGTCPKEIRVT